MLTTSRQKQGAQWSAILSYYIQVSIVNFPTLNEDGQYEPSQLQLHGMYIEMVADDNIQISLALAPTQSHWSRAVSGEPKCMNILCDALMPCPFTGPKMFWAGPNFLSHPKNLTSFSAFSKTFVPAQKPILLNANHLFVWHKMFVTATICR